MEDPSVSVPRQVLYDLYLNFCDDWNEQPLSTPEFGRLVRSAFPDLTVRRLGRRKKSRYESVCSLC